MKFSKSFFLQFISCILFSKIVYGQENKNIPVAVESVIGTSRYGLQTVINKHLPDSKNLTFFSIANFESKYTNKPEDLNYFINSQFSYQVYRGMGVSIGVNVNKNTGLVPTLGMQYVYSDSKWLLVVSPSYLFSSDKNISMLSIVEFKPQLSKNIILYTRVQGFYNENIEKSVNEQSYLQLRLGLNYKGYQFGLASNLNYFEKNHSLTKNFGIFLRINI